MNKDEFALVLMPFDESFEQVYHGVIYPAVTNSNLRCVRVDNSRYPENIVDKIMEFIYHATIIVADISSLKPGVIYELGVAHARGNNAIMISQNRLKGELFHLKEYRVVDYKTDIKGGSELKEKLEKLIINRKDWIGKPNNPVQNAWGKYKLAEPLSLNPVRPEPVPQIITNLDLLIYELVGKNELEQAITQLVAKKPHSNVLDRLYLVSQQLDHLKVYEAKQLSRKKRQENLDKIRIEILELSNIICRSQ